MNTDTDGTIAPQIFTLTAFLSVTWGIYLGHTIGAYRRALRTRGRGLIVREFRRMVVAFCLWLICFSFVFRTALVLVGLGDEWVGQLLFFTLAGSSVLGSVFAVVSLWFDDD